MVKTPVYGQLVASLGLTDCDLTRFSYQENRATNEGINPGLVLDRYLPIPFDGDCPTSFNSETKGPWLKEFVTQSNRAYTQQQAPWRTWVTRQHEFFTQLPYASYITINPQWRWIVGIGNASILETGITLHKIYGIPYIPGSALKGLTQAWAGTWREPILDPENFCKIFGEQTSDNPHLESQQRAGEVVFLGAYPDSAKPPKLIVDVMTPHFPKYYQGEREYPLEIEDPIPIPFLAVQGGRYRAYFAARNSKLANVDINIVKQAKELCTEALDDLGVGGKTAKGYGYFNKNTGT